MSAATTQLIVVGGSQGGLEAATALFEPLPADFPAAIAMVQHRSTMRGTGLVRLLDRATLLPVIEPDHGTPVEAGHIFLAPAGYHLLIDDGHFALSVDPPVSHARPSIDVLFETAAESHESRLVGILLSAASSDGAAGIAAIARHGGTTIVQDPTTAANASAVRKALAATPVDHCLPPKAIAEFLIRQIPSPRTVQSMRPPPLGSPQ